MKSSAGKYFVGLDHVRALAAFTVFAWHFNHINNGHVAPPPMFPFSFFTEGHIGVAIFMVLSGYLFAKLLDGQRIKYWPFLWNRAIRLLPLLFLVVAIVGYQKVASGVDPETYLRRILNGAIYPSLPNGGWSITVEFHFYIILPLALFLMRIDGFAPLGLMVMAIVLRWMLWDRYGSVQNVAYFSIGGCIDQFLMGLFFYHYRHALTQRHVVAGVIGAAVLIYMVYFDQQGGFYRNGRYPSPSWIWIVHPAILAVGFGALIAWYDTSFRFSQSGLSRAVAWAGSISYSFYLLHFFYFRWAAKLVNDHVIALDNYLVVFVATIFAYVAFLPVAYASFVLFERPFLRFRVPYLK